MASKVVRFDTTPNPNAIKCVLDGPITDAPRSYFKPEEASEAADAVAVALFAVPGITNVLIHSDWISVCKTPDAPWGAIKEGVRAALAKADSHGA